MLFRRSTLLLSSFLLLYAAHSQAQPEKPTDTTVCAVRQNPKVWDRRLVRLTGYATHGYEESSIVDPACGQSSDGSPLWMEYGGRIGSATMYFGGDHKRRRKTDMAIEGMAIPLVEDEKFHQLDHILQRSLDKTGVVAVATTVEGRFFWGRGYDSPGPSFGHFGCCSLLVIQKVNSVADQPLNAKQERKAPETFHLPPPPPPQASPTRRRSR